MLKNSVYYKSLISFIVLLFVITCLNAESQMTPYEKFDFAYDVLGDVKAEINTKKDTLDQYFSVRTTILAQLAANREEERQNVLSSFTSLEGAIVALGEQIMDTMDGIQLNNALNGVNTSIEEFINDEIDVGIFQRQGNIDTGTGVGYNQAFANLVTTYGDLSAETRSDANELLFDSRSSEVVDLSQSTINWSVPGAETAFVQPCNNPSGRCYGYYPNPDKHKETCPLKHGTAGTTNKTWWSCFDASCTRSSEHWIECRALCGELCPPPTREYYDNYQYRLQYHDHEKVCTEPVFNIL